MRNLFTKLTFVAGAALAVAACGGSETANTTDNSMMSDMNTMEPAGTTNDMTAVDGAAMDNGSMAMDNGSMGMDNGAMASDNMSNAM